jgi:hypothetical protein
VPKYLEDIDGSNWFRYLFYLFSRN